MTLDDDATTVNLRPTHVHLALQADAFSKHTGNHAGSGSSAVTKIKLFTITWPNATAMLSKLLWDDNAITLNLRPAHVRLALHIQADTFSKYPKNVVQG